MRKAIQQFPPVYFALVMATGILSLVAHNQHLETVATALLYLNLVAYPVLLVLLVLRLSLHFRATWAELTSHIKGPTFLTLVPATCLLGSQLVQLRQQQELGAGLWLAGVVLWVLLMYSLLLGVSQGPEKPPLEKEFSGAWLLLVVATQALVTLGARLEPGRWGAPDVFLFSLLGVFLLGSFLYLAFSTVLLYRLVFRPLPPEEVGAAYWISVGASAITTLAGASLVSRLGAEPSLSALVPLVKGLSLLFWAVSTWWLPLTAGLRLWNHLTTRPAFTFAPSYWSMVFPLGMYAAATGQLAQAWPLPALGQLVPYELYIALAAWGLTLLAMFYHLTTAATKSGDQA